MFPWLHCQWLPWFIGQSKVPRKCEFYSSLSMRQCSPWTVHCLETAIVGGTYRKCYGVLKYSLATFSNTLSLKHVNLFEHMLIKFCHQTKIATTRIPKQIALTCHPFDNDVMPMDTLSASLALCAGNPSGTARFAARRKLLCFEHV